MEERSGSMEKWRKYFMSANTDIFEVIKNAVMLAAMDSPEEFKLRRDQIAELLFSCKVTKCFRCDEVGLVVPGEEREEEKCKSEMDARRDHSCEDGRMKEKQLNSGVDDENEDDHGEGDDVEEADLNHHHHISYGEVEALTDEIEEESLIFSEVLRIKGVLENSKDESDSALYDSLKNLEFMDLSMEILKATEIGKSVKVLVKHGSDKIKRLAETLLKYWVAKVDAWLNAPEAIAHVSEGTPDSMKKSDVYDEEEGLPSPPLDEGAFFLTETAPVEWGEFFDGMDENGNPRKCGTKNRENGRKPSAKNSNVDIRKQPHESIKPSTEKKGQLPHQSVKPSNDRKGQQLHLESVTPPTDRTGLNPKKQGTLDKKQATAVKSNKPSLGESGPGRPTKPSVEQDTNMFEFKSQKKPDRVTIQKRELASQQNKLRNPDEEAELKLEASKRKLHERYQEAQNAKKQRTVQVVELRDIPKLDVGQRNAHMRPGNNGGGRFRANGRR